MTGKGGDRRPFDAGQPNKDQDRQQVEDDIDDITATSCTAAFANAAVKREDGRLGSYTATKSWGRPSRKTRCRYLFGHIVDVWRVLPDPEGRIDDEPQLDDGCSLSPKEYQIAV